MVDTGELFHLWVIEGTALQVLREKGPFIMNDVVGLAAKIGDYLYQIESLGIKAMIAKLID